MRRTLRFVGALATLSVLAACSSGDDSSSPDTTFGATTVASSIVPLTTTTTIAGTPVSDAELYAEIGLTPEQGACIDESGVNGDFETSLGPGPLDALTLIGDDGTMIAVPASLRTGTELEQTMLDALAKDCAPAELLAELARVDGTALDDATIADDLPVRLYQRRADGATEAELACLDAGFRAAPARLTSLAANPVLVEAPCASPERRATWRRNAFDRALSTAGAPDEERVCLMDTPADQALLGAAVDAVGSGDTSTNPLAGTEPACAGVERMYQLAVDILASGADFGAEPIAPG